MRVYQEEIYSALCRKGDWIGDKTSVTTLSGITKVVYYRTTIAVVNHIKKTAEFDNGGYNTASTTSRINAVKMFCDDNHYTY